LHRKLRKAHAAGKDKKECSTKDKKACGDHKNYDAKHKTAENSSKTTDKKASKVKKSLKIKNSEFVSEFFYLAFMNIS
jgi:hypothetical protein